MKNRFLKLNSPCTESWDNMKPSNGGSFCGQCAKTVIDFTTLDPSEIGRIMKKNGNVCARVTKMQLASPLPDPVSKTYESPYSNIAAGLLLASTIVAGQPSQAQNPKDQIELTQSANNEVQTQTRQKPQADDAKPGNFIPFKGEIHSKDGKAIENAKVTLVTVNKLITVYTRANGTFTMQIPAELVDDDNVIRVSYNEIKLNEDKSRHFYGYDTEDYIFTKKDMESAFHITAEDTVLYLGGIGSYRKTYEPVVLSNGREIKYKDFINARHGEKSSCNLENKEYMFFESKAAVAIYGKKAKDGLYIITDISPE